MDFIVESLALSAKLIKPMLDAYLKQNQASIVSPSFDKLRAELEKQVQDEGDKSFVARAKTLLEMATKAKEGLTFQFGRVWP